VNARSCRFIATTLLAFSSTLFAQTAPATPAMKLADVHVTASQKSPAPNEFKNLTYLKIGENSLTLDVFQNPKPGLSPVLVYYHGGGWWKGERPQSYASFRSFLAMGFSIVNVDYRLTPVAPAPAAVQDARCALSWIKQNATKYNFDVDRVVVYGTSAGGHLALMSGMLPASSDIDLAQCKDLPKVAAILDFYGPADLMDITGTENKRGWATRWITDAPDAAAMAKRMSPMTYVRSGLPPVFIVHGDADPTVPYPQSVRLQTALDAVSVPNKLFTVAGGVHGKFDDDQKKAIQSAIREFLIGQKVLSGK
jgi:acetyl esterase/lipase